MVLYLYKEQAEEAELFPHPRLFQVIEKDSGDISPPAWYTFYELQRNIAIFIKVIVVLIPYYFEVTNIN